MWLQKSLPGSRAVHRPRIRRPGDRRESEGSSHLVGRGPRFPVGDAILDVDKVEVLAWIIMDLL